MDTFTLMSIAFSLRYLYLHVHGTGHNNIAFGCDGKIYIQQKRWIKSFDPVTQEMADVVSEKFVRKIPRSNADSPCLGISCVVQVCIHPSCAVGNRCCIDIPHLCVCHKTGHGGSRRGHLLHIQSKHRKWDHKIDPRWLCKNMLALHN